MKPLALGAIVLLAALSCDGRRATDADCQAIFDRIVELELRELGFNDPELTRRRQAELHTRYRDEIDTCVGRRLSPQTMACVQHAESAERLSHECF